MKKIFVLGLLGFAMLFATSCIINMGIDSYADAAKYSVMTDSVTFDTNITELDLTWHSGNVDISMYDENYISISETANQSLSSKKRLHYYMDGTKLRLQFCESNFSAGSSLKKDLVIKLPRSTYLSNLNIDNAACDIKFTDINADNANITTASGQISGNFASNIQNFKIDSASGDIIIKSANVNSLKIDSASGNLDFTGTYIKNVDLDAACGNHSIKSTETAIDSLILDKTAGDTKIYIPENDGFVVNINKLAGNVSSTFETADTKTEKAYGNKSRVYNVNMTSGNLSIIKIEE